MAQIPANTKMWNMFVAQAKTRFNKWPSATASAWVHQHYTQAGGKFVESTKQLTPKEKLDHDISERKKKADKKKGLK